MGYCLTADMCRRYLKPYEYVFPPTDNERLLSLDEILATWQIDPVYGTGANINRCYDSPGIYYGHYYGETVGSGRVLYYGLNNTSGTGWIASSTSQPAVVWHAAPSADTGSDSFDDAYTNTYNIVSARTATGAPAAYEATDYNADTVEWVLPGATQAQWIDALKQNYGGYTDTTSIWTSTQGSSPFTLAVYMDLVTHQGYQVSKYNTYKVVPVRAYNDGIVYTYITGNIIVNGASSKTVRWTIKVRSYDGGLLPQITTSQRAGAYFVTVGYTDPANPAQLYKSTYITNGLSSEAYIDVEYPMTTGYTAICGDHPDANWGQENAQQGSVYIPGFV